jgi:hypothetical protein
MVLFHVLAPCSIRKMAELNDGNKKATRGVALGKCLFLENCLQISVDRRSSAVRVWFNWVLAAVLATRKGINSPPITICIDFGHLGTLVEKNIFSRPAAHSDPGVREVFVSY